MPSLGVFMPNYNDAPFIDRAIEAIVNQSRRPDRFLIIDDCSTDDSINVISRYQKKYPLIEFEQHSTNRGAIASLQDGWKKLDTDYVYGASADDYVLPGFFESAMRLATQYPQAGIIFGDMVTVDENDKILNIASVRKWKTERFATPRTYQKECLDTEPPSHSWSASTIYRREALREIGGFANDLGSWCDTFAIRAIGLKHGVCYVGIPCVAWRTTTDGYSSKSRNNSTYYLSLLKTAANKMRSESYKNVFPEKHVRRWYIRYVLQIKTKAFLNSLMFKNLFKVKF